MTGLEIISFALANAPAAIKTFGELKALWDDGFARVKDAITDDMTVDQARAEVLKLMDEIAANSARIQSIE